MVLHDIIDGETPVEWYTGSDRCARVKTRTIAFGLVNADDEPLRGAAERDGGRFIIVTAPKDRNR